MFVDDNESFLQALHTVLHGSGAFTGTFWSSPRAALQFLNERYQPDPFTNRFSKAIEASAVEHYLLATDIENLYKESNNPKRFDQISTVVVDYDMPEINGIEFCRHIRVPHVQKILLTGAADEQLAVEAFNKRWIDGFVRKQDKGFEDTLKNVVSDAQKNYFLRLSSTMLSSSKGAVTDPVFADYFYDILAQNHIVEYYLFEHFGSFVLIDSSANIYGFFTHNKDQVDAAYYEIKDEGLISQTLKDGLRNYQNMFCYKVSTGHNMPPVEAWKNHIFKAHALHGFETYYCAFTRDVFHFDTSDILPFEQYCKPFGNLQMNQV